MEKSAGSIWQICCKAVLLHPLSREKRGTVEMLERDEVLNLPLQEKLFLKISSEKFWWFKNKPYLCIRFPKESRFEEAIFERFRYEQASSTSLT